MCLALGAQRRDIAKMVLGQGLAVAIAGTAIGVGGALFLTRFVGPATLRGQGQRSVGLHRRRLSASRDCAGGGVAAGAPRLARGSDDRAPARIRGAGDAERNHQVKIFQATVGAHQFGGAVDDPVQTGDRRGQPQFRSQNCADCQLPNSSPGNRHATRVVASARASCPTNIFSASARSRISGTCSGRSFWRRTRSETLSQNGPRMYTMPWTICEPSSRDWTPTCAPSGSPNRPIKLNDRLSASPAPARPQRPALNSASEARCQWRLVGRRRYPTGRCCDLDQLAIVPSVDVAITIAADRGGAV